MSTITLDATEVRNAVSMRDAIGAIRQAMLDLSAGDFEQPVRTAMRDGQFLTMSTHHRPTSSAVVKTLSLDFNRVPAIAGTVTWVETAQPGALVADAAPITGLRTGAIAGVATDLLAPTDATHMAMIGAGGQAPDQVRAVHVVRPLQHLTIFDRDRSRAETMANDMADELTGVHIEVVSSAEEAAGAGDIVSCATPATEPVLATSDLKARVHVNAIGAFRPTMRELPDDLLAESLLVIDDMEAILKESGEILHAIDAGALKPDDMTVLGAALTYGLPAAERTVFKTVGVGAQDWAIARLLAAKYLPSTVDA